MKHGLNTDEIGFGLNPKLLHESLTQEIIGAAFEVHNVLGYGFLEKVYQRALQTELLRRNINAEVERRITIRYKDIVVGDYVADLFIEGKVIVELKVSKSYNTEDEAQLLNELKATGVKIVLLINFGRAKVEFKRLIF
jgi:GxxExxY protein